MSTTAGDVVQVLDCLAAAGVHARLSGGWGVDALWRRQTRQHRDLDLAVDATLLPDAMGALAEDGFVVTTDWLPVRVELSAGEVHLDLHPLSYRADGSAWQAGLGDTRFDYPADAWTTGRVETRDVTCLSVVMQRLFHAGYPPREVDRHDVEVLDRVELRSVRANPRG